MTEKSEAKEMTDLEKTTQPSIPVEVAPGIFLTRRQVWLRAKAIIKAHSLMDGSGHLLLREKGVRVKGKTLKNLIAHVHQELLKQGIDDSGARIDTMIKMCMPTLTRRTDWHHQINWVAREKARKKREKEALKLRPSQPQEQPTLKSTRTEVRQITVTVRKARSFHYPRDLPSGGDA